MFQIDFKLILLSIIITCCLNLVSGINNTSCVPVKPPAVVSPIRIAEVISFIKSQETNKEILEDIHRTESETVEQLLVYGSGADNEDAHLNIKQLIIKYGRDVEEHEVETEDGYLLTMYRIPGNGSVVFVMHGLLGSADDWVTAGPESALAYNLVDEGYDVWLGNARGNVHSKKHVSRNPECDDFWDFSWDEIGRYDLPAMIDYVLNVTGQSKLFYIGFSQGTTSFFVMCSELPNYNEKISAMIALSPVVYMSHLRSPLVRLAFTGSDHFAFLLEAFGIYEVFSRNSLTDALITYFCGSNELDSFVCSSFIYFLTGFGQLNITNFPVIFSHSPVSSATKQLAHYGQEVISGKFRRYDYGRSGNIKRYGTDTPPDYPLAKVTAPVWLFYSDEDWVSSVTDVMLLKNELSNVSLHFIEKYCHIDFQWARNVKELVNMEILKVFKTKA